MYLMIYNLYIQLLTLERNIFPNYDVHMPQSLILLVKTESKLHFSPVSILSALRELSAYLSARSPVADPTLLSDLSPTR